MATICDGHRRDRRVTPCVRVACPCCADSLRTAPRPGRPGALVPHAGGWLHVALPLDRDRTSTSWAGES